MVLEREEQTPPLPPIGSGSENKPAGRYLITDAELSPIRAESRGRSGVTSWLSCTRTIQDVRNPSSASVKFNKTRSAGVSSTFLSNSLWESTITNC